MVAYLKLFILMRLSRGRARAGHAGHCEIVECKIRLGVARNINTRSSEKLFALEEKKYTIRNSTQGTGEGQDMRR